MERDSIRLVDADLVGQHEIAERLGVTQQAVHNWTKRQTDFPQPIVALFGGRGIWWWDEIKAWVLNSGRAHLLDKGAANGSCTLRP